MEAEARKFWEDRDADAGWTAGKGERYQAGLSRLGLNRVENIKALTEQWDSVDHDLAPMVVVPYEEFKKYGKLPRSSDRKTVPLSEVGQDGRILFCSHNWMRGGKEQCERNGHKWEGSAHPDDEKGTKHTLLCASVEQLAKDKKWELGKVYIWLDFCGIEQDIVERKGAGVQSLRGYVAVCDAIIVPYPHPPPADASTVDRLQTYGERGWTRLEAMVAYIMGILRGLEAPDIYVAWREGDCTFQVKQFDYSLDPDHLPASCGKEHLTDEGDRPALEEHQNKLLEEMKASVKRNGYITKHGGEVKGLGDTRPGEVKSVAFHPTRRGVLASAGEDKVVKLVKQETGTTLLKMEGAATAILSIAFNQDGSLLAGGGEDGNIYLWDVQSGKKQGTLRGHSRSVNSVAWNHDGSLLASGSKDGTVRLFTPDGQEKGTLKGHSVQVNSVAFSPDSKFVASGSGTHQQTRDQNDNSVRIWEVVTGREVCSMKGHSRNNPECTCKHGQESYDRYVANPECPVTTHSAMVSCVAWNHDGSLLASGSFDRTVRLWTPDGQEKGTLRGHGENNTECTCRKDHAADLYHANPECPVRWHSFGVLSVAWNHDGSLLASASNDGTVWLCTPDGEEKGTLTEDHYSVCSVAWNHDWSLLAFGNLDGTVRLWTPGQEKGTQKGHRDNMICVAWNHDGSLFASGSEDGTVRLWTPYGEGKGTLRGHSAFVNSVAFSPDSKFIASCSGDSYGGKDYSVRIWDVSTGEEVCTLKGHSDEVNCVAWNHDGSLLASGSDDGTVRLWTPEGQEKGTLKEDSRSVKCVAWNHDGSLLASGSDGGTVRLWTPDVQQKDTLTGHTGTPESSLQALAAIHTRFDMDVAEAYEVWDDDEDGVVSLEDLETAFGYLNTGLSGEQIRELHEHLVHLGSCDEGGVTEDAWVEAVSAAVESDLDVVYNPVDPSTDPHLKCTLTGHTMEDPECTCNHFPSYRANPECPLRGHYNDVNCVTWNHDGSLLASGSDDGNVRLWAPDGEEKGTLRGHKKGHTKDNLDCTCTHQDDHHPEYTADRGCPVRWHSLAVLSVAWNHDGSQLASASRDRTVRLWTPDGQEKGSLTGEIASWHGLDPKTKDLAAKAKQGGSTGSNRTGQYIVTAKGDMVYVYRTHPEGEKQRGALACFRSPARVENISCKGTKVVAGCEDGQVLFLEAPLLAGGQ